MDRTLAEELTELAALLAARNTIDARIGVLLNRPVTPGNLGEWIAARVFNIRLEDAANTAAIDGVFTDGPLAGKTVNVKFYGKDEGLLDVSTSPALDYYLVLAGPRGAAASSRGAVRPVRITTAYLIDAQQLLTHLRGRGVKIGVATSVTRAVWNAAEIYPQTTCASLPLNPEQRRLLALFS